MAEWRNVDELERHVGEQVRTLRLRANITQDDLARQADVSTSTVRNLEAGRGASLATLAKVVRALGRDEWLDSLAPPVSISPLQMARGQRPATARKRASRSSRAR